MTTLDRGDPRLPSLAYGSDHKDWLKRLNAYISLRGFRVWRDPEELRAIIEPIVAAHPKEATAYRRGKSKVLGFFIAKVMVATRDGADPELAISLFKAAILGD